MKRLWFLMLALAVAAPAGSHAQSAGDFPLPSRPVAAIVTNQWSDEASREAAGEAETVLRLARVAPGQTVADIGAGAGYYAVKLSQAVGPKGRVIAEDIMPQYVEGLRERVRRERLGNVQVVLGTADDPKLAPNSIDRAFMIHMYHEIAQPFALLWRLHAAMKPGGLVAIVDANRPTSSHGTPPRLLACELAAVGFRQVSRHNLGKAGGYLALFEPSAPRPAPAAIKPCAQDAR